MRSGLAAPCQIYFGEIVRGETQKSQQEVENVSAQGVSAIARILRRNIRRYMIMFVANIADDRPGLCQHLPLLNHFTAPMAPAPIAGVQLSRLTRQNRWHSERPGRTLSRQLTLSHLSSGVEGSHWNGTVRPGYLLKRKINNLDLRSSFRLPRPSCLRHRLQASPRLHVNRSRYYITNFQWRQMSR